METLSKLDYRATIHSPASSPPNVSMMEGDTQKKLDLLYVLYNSSVKESKYREEQKDLEIAQLRKLVLQQAEELRRLQK